MPAGRAARRQVRADRRAGRAGERAADRRPPPTRASSSTSTRPAPATASTPTGCCTSPRDAGSAGPAQGAVPAGLLHRAGRDRRAGRARAVSRSRSDWTRRPSGGCSSRDEYGEDVRADEAQAHSYGISGVPFFVVDDRYGISGAQPTDLFSQALNQAWDESHPHCRRSPPPAAAVPAARATPATSDDGRERPGPRWGPGLRRARDQADHGGEPAGRPLRSD